jgi:hypothetical protein
MLKKVKELSKDEKILLLQAVANKKINPEYFNENTLCACEYSDYFLGLMVASSCGAKVIVLGEARKAMKQLTF